MALILLTSASGAPGVSTTALGLALAWPSRVLLIEADPGGGSTVLAGWFQGRPPHDRGVVNLAMALAYAAPDADPSQWLPGALSDVVVAVPGTTVEVVTGIRAPAQAGALADLWPPLAATAGELECGGVDVIVDAGRLGMAHAPAALVDAADVVLLTTGTSLPALAAARGWSRELAERFGAVGRTDHLGLLVIGSGRPYPAREACRLLDLPLVAALPWDPRTAQAVHLGRASKRLARSPLASALRAATTPIIDLATRNRHRLGGRVAAAGGVG